MTFKVASIPNDTLPLVHLVHSPVLGPLGQMRPRYFFINVTIDREMIGTTDG